MPNLNEIQPYTKSSNYQINVSWKMLEDWLKHQNEEDTGIDLDPDFQRPHVWTEAQQIAYVEYRLKQGVSGRILYWNHQSWQSKFNPEHKLVLVDGKQRLNAVLRFLHNEIPAFGCFLKDYEGHLDHVRHDFIMCINDLATRREVLEWYIHLNAGGTPHTDEEIEHVRKLLLQEKATG